MPKISQGCEMSQSIIPARNARANQTPHKKAEPGSAERLVKYVATVGITPLSHHSSSALLIVFLHPLRSRCTAEKD